MKKILSFLFILSLFSSNICLSQSGWFPLNPVTSSTLSCVYFVNPDTGFLVSYIPSLIFRTTNGGTNWTQIPYNAGSIWLLKVQFVDPITGWIVGCEPSPTGANVILKTTNSGLNWFAQYQGTGTLRTICFINSLTGFAAGEKFLKTTNAGVNWIEATPPGLNVAYNLQFINELTGWISCLPPNPNTIIKTTDGGNGWFTQMTGVNVVDICFVSAETGFCGIDGAIMKTTNGGTNWSLSYSCSNGLFFSFTNPLTGWSVIQNSSGFRRILRTTNAGGNWVDQGYSNPIFLNDIVMYSSMIGWAIGHEGVIYKTTNGGEPVGIKQIGSEIPSSFSLSQNYPNPFNPVTTIKYDIPPSKGARGMMTRLIIYDVLGREIETLVNQTQRPGSYEVSWDGSRYASGVYFYKLMTENFAATKRMVLIK